MTDMYLKLGTQVLTGKVYGEIKTEGGYYDVKQDGATSLRTGARKGDPKGFSASFFVCFATEAEASAFLAYVAPYSPEDSDFDEEAGADIDLFLRTSDWKYKVWGVVVKPAALNKSPMDYLQYLYEVVCYCYSPFSEAAAPTAFSMWPISSPLLDISITPAGDPIVVDAQHCAYYYSGGVWYYVAGSISRISYGSAWCWVDTSGQVVYNYSVIIGSGVVDVSIAFDGSIFAVGAGGGIYKYNGSTWDTIGSGATRISAVSGSLAYIINSGGQCWKWDGASWSYVAEGGYTNVSAGSDGTLVVCTGVDMYLWNGSAFVVALADVSHAATASGSLFFAVGTDGDFRVWAPPWTVILGNDEFDLTNATGHLASAPSIIASTAGQRPANITLAIADSETLILATQANSAETWELKGNENTLLQTYEDAITAGAQWGRDWTGDGTFDTDHMELDNGESAYIILSGPHPARIPVKMTADLSLDSGGATGEATVDISPDGVAWQTVLDQDDFESGSAEYVLQGSEYMTDIYVRISCNSGTSGKKVNIGSIKFEVERWIEDGAVPSVAAGATKTMVVSATGGAIAVSGSFTPRRKFL